MRHAKACQLLHRVFSHPLEAVRFETRKPIEATNIDNGTRVSGFPVLIDCTWTHRPLALRRARPVLCRYRKYTGLSSQTRLRFTFQPHFTFYRGAGTIPAYTAPAVANNSKPITLSRFRLAARTTQVCPIKLAIDYAL